MGITDTKTISNQIDTHFKSIRKYNDHFYGEITLLQHKINNKKYVLVEKTILILEKSISQYLELRKTANKYLVTLSEFYNCNIDYCSGLKKYFFLLQYDSHTLYQEMVRRQQDNNKFTQQQILNIFSQMLEILSILKEQKHFQSLISNHHILYFSPNELKTLEALLKVENDTFQFDFHLIAIENGMKQLYLSPQAFYLLCNRERFEAKNISLKEQSIIFMLGMSFLQCALLADITEVYNSSLKCLNFQKIKLILREVQNFYGEQIAQILSQMVSQNASKRPRIQKIKDLIGNIFKRRKITIPKTIRAQRLQIKQFNKYTLFSHKIR